MGLCSAPGLSLIHILFACAQGRGNGYGQMRALKYDQETGSFAEADRFLSRTWDEPRHAAVHPNNRWRCV